MQASSSRRGSLFKRIDALTHPDGEAAGGPGASPILTQQALRASKVHIVSQNHTLASVVSNSWSCRMGPVPDPCHLLGSCPGTPCLAAGAPRPCTTSLGDLPMTIQSYLVPGSVSRTLPCPLNRHTSHVTLSRCHKRLHVLTLPSTELCHPCPPPCRMYCRSASSAEVPLTAPQSPPLLVLQSAARRLTARKASNRCICNKLQ